MLSKHHRYYPAHKAEQRRGASLNSRPWSDYQVTAAAVAGVAVAHVHAYELAPKEAEQALPEHLV